MNRRAMPSPITRLPYRVATVCAAALALAACNPAGGGGAGEPPLAGAAIGGPFTLTASDGRTVQWEDFAGKYRMVYFGYAYCPDICPVDVQRMMQGYNAFAKVQPALAARIQPIFITVDPERDTPEVVGEFTRAFSPRLLGLTGTSEQVAAAAKTFGVYAARGTEQPGGGYLMDHSRVTYLFGPEGQPLATLPVDQGGAAVAAELAKWVR